MNHVIELLLSSFVFLLGLATLIYVARGLPQADRGGKQRRYAYLVFLSVVLAAFAVYTIKNVIQG